MLRYDWSKAVLLEIYRRGQFSMTDYLPDETDIISRSVFP